MAETILTEEEFDRLLVLSRLTVTPEEKKRLMADLTEILGYCNRIASLELSAPSDYYFPNQSVRPLREDEPTPGLIQQQALANAPEKLGEFFVVPRVVRRDP